MSLKIKITTFIYNIHISKLLFKEEKGRFSTIRIQLQPDIRLNEDTFPSSLTRILVNSFQLSLDYVAILNAEVTINELKLCLLFSTSDLGDPRKLASEEVQWISLDNLARSNASDALQYLAQQAEDVCRRRNITTDLSEVNDTVNRHAISFLGQNIVSKHGLVGWPHYLGQETIGVIGTALGILCFLHTNSSSLIIQNAIRTLRVSQNDDGGFPIRSLVGKSNISITESTLFALWALIDSGSGAEDETVVRGISWLEKTQKQSGGWGSSEKVDRVRVFPTAFAVRVLSKVDPRSNVVKSGTAWLQSARNSDGGWGAFSSDSAYSTPSSPVHTAHTMIALLLSGISKESELIRGGARWLLSNYSDEVEEGWSSQAEVEYVDDNSAIDFRHFSTPWCVIALTNSGTPLFQNEVLNPIRGLLSSQHALGYWSHHLAPGQMPIWATHDCLFAIKEVLLATSSQIHFIASGADSERESKTLRNALLEFAHNITEQSIHSSGRIRKLYAWNLLITFTLIALIFSHPSFIFLISSYSLSAQITSYLVTIGGAFVVGFAPFIYQIFLEEFKIRRGISTGHRKE